jgi:two-component system LytT family sensor kinase
MTSAGHAQSLRLLRRTGAALLFWTALGVIFALPQLGQSAAWRTPLSSSLAQWWAWGLLSPLIVLADLRLPFPSSQIWRRLLAHLMLLGPAITFGFVYVSAALAAAMGAGPWGLLVNWRPLSAALQGKFLWGMVVYCLIIGVWRAYHFQQRAVSAELQAERSERNFSQARLNALRMQLDPHFLFNALNTISSQVERDPRLARTMIEHLGSLLRLSLESHNRHELPLLEELAFLDHYLAIQHIRLGDRLHVQMNISPQARLARVPSLILQPLVENAIRHGVSQKSAGGTVWISAQRHADQLEIDVLDDGVGLPAGWSLQECVGLGLSVTRERVAGLHPGGEARFTVTGREGGGTVVHLSFPYELAGEKADRPEL